MGKYSQIKTRQILRRYNSMRIVMITEGVLVGVVAGLVSVLFRYLLGEADGIRTFILQYCQGKPLYIAGWFAALVGIAFLISRLNRWEPMISGSGIPQVEAELTGYIRPNWWKVIVAKIVGGFLCIVGGLSLGREGPSIQLGAMAGKGVSKFLRRFRLEEHFLITCGASAGLAAAFNAPLAGVMFALEELHRNFSPIIMASAMSSALTADYIASGLFGLTPIFTFPAADVVPLHYYPILILLGVACGLFSVFYNKMLLWSQDFYKALAFLPDWMRLSIPLLVAGVLGFTVPEVLGGGHEMITLLYSGELVLESLAFLLLVKFLFSMLSFGSGAPGGIFFPLLVLGAYFGAVFGSLTVQFGMVSEQFFMNIIIVAMAALFAGIVRAPVTGVILICEMTGNFTQLLPLATASLIAYVVAELMHSKPIYDSLMERMLVSHNVKVAKGRRGRKSLLNSTVEAGSEADNRCIRDLGLPSTCLIVSVTRGDEELIPNGDLRLKAGDILATLVQEQDMLAMESVLRHKVAMDDVSKKEGAL